MIGNTPTATLKTPKLGVEYTAKIELCNASGSVKDRFAKHAIEQLLESGEISTGDRIVESSSGNFGLALAYQAKQHGLKFTCVIDPKICPRNESLLRQYGAEIVKVQNHDENGGYLLSRLNKVEEIQKDGAFWLNQYASKYAPESYLEIVDEILKVKPNIDYFFVGVGTGGTLAGISRRLRILSPKTKIIAVDVVGSLVFSDCAKPRCIPGMGSRLKSKQLTETDYDEVVIVPELDGVAACYSYQRQGSILLGGSSGVIVAAIDKYFSDKTFSDGITIVTVFPDGGSRYLETIYNRDWLRQCFKGEEDDLLK